MSQETHTIRHLLNAYKTGTKSADIAAQYLDAIKNDTHGAFISVANSDELLAQASGIDAARARGEDPGVLGGVPIALKDNICVKGGPVSAGSKILDQADGRFISPYDATVVSKLKAAGALILGKTNLDEFAMGSSNENSAFGAVKNPADPERVPGGSSGGSAAAVAANLCAAALGSDTGGSIRQPAAFTGTVGLKPTYGRVSRFGLIAFASSLDQIGPMTHTVEDAALMLNLLAGPCPHDMTSMDVPSEDWTQSLGRGVEGLKVGVPKEYFGPGVEGLSPEVRASVQETLERLESEGAKIQEVSLPHTKYAVATYYLLATAEASSNLARFDGVRYGHRAEARELQELYTKSRSEGFGPEVKRRIMLGTYVLSAGFYDAYYKKAQSVRTLITRDFEETFKSVDVILGPTTPNTAFKLGEKTNDPLQMYLEDIFTISCNLAGLPGISVPGPTSGLPIGIQILAPHFREDLVFQAASVIENGGRS